MNEILLHTLAFGGPVLLGLLAVLVGRGSVRRLRVKTGDDSWLTSVLSGQLFGRPGQRRPV